MRNFLVLLDIYTKKEVNMSDQFMNKLNEFAGKNVDQMKVGEEVCDQQTGKCYVKTNDGLVEKKIDTKKVITEDGRQVLYD